MISARSKRRKILSLVFILRSILMAENTLAVFATCVIVLRTVPTNSMVFLRVLLNMREMQNLTSVIEIQNENWG